MLAEKTYKRRRSSLIPIAAAVLLTATFIFYNYVLRETYDPNKEYQNLLDSKLILGFKDWKLMMESCSDSEVCQPTGDYAYEQSLPASNDLKLIDRIAQLKNTEKPPTHANVIYQLSEQEIQWIQQRNELTLLIPRSVQNSVTLILPDREIKLDAFGVNLYFNLTPQDLHKLEIFKLRFDIRDLPWFGPADLPIVLGEIAGIYDYSRLTDKQQFTGNVGRALELSTRLLVALMAIVLDHSRPFSYLALYAMGRSLRDVNAIIIEFGFDGASFLDNIHFFNFVNALCATALIIFFATMFQMRCRPKLQFTLFFGCLSLLYIWLGIADEQMLWRYSDMVTDSAGCIIALGIIVYGSVQNQLKSTAKKTPQDQLNLNRILLNSSIFLRSALLAVGLFSHLYFNLQVLWETQSEPFKDMLDPKNFVLSYVMVIAALTEVGSTSKAMFRFSKKMVKQATMEKDLEMGRKVQQEMMPIRKFSTSLWSWRTLYVPATELAGDWFDLRTLKIGEREFLAGAICDVTGHGVGAAMMTSTISSHWGLWCRGFELLDNQALDLESSFREVIDKIHAGLSCLRTNQGATGAFFLIDPLNWKMLYATPGHPGILISSAHRFQYLTSQGPRMGGDEFSVKIQTHQLSTGDQVFLFTDGIMPPRESVSRHINRWKKAVCDDGRSLTEVLVRGIRSNRRLFRADPELEDDMTLMILKIAPLSFEKQLAS